MRPKFNDDDATTVMSAAKIGRMRPRPSAYVPEREEKTQMLSLEDLEEMDAAPKPPSSRSKRESAPKHRTQSRDSFVLPEPPAFLPRSVSFDTTFPPPKSERSSESRKASLQAPRTPFSFSTSPKTPAPFAGAVKKSATLDFSRPAPETNLDEVVDAAELLEPSAAALLPEPAGNAFWATPPVAPKSATVASAAAPAAVKKERDSLAPVTSSESSPSISSGTLAVPVRPAPRRSTVTMSLAAASALSFAVVLAGAIGGVVSAVVVRGDAPKAAAAQSVRVERPRMEMAPKAEPVVAAPAVAAASAPAEGVTVDEPLVIESSTDAAGTAKHRKAPKAGSKPHAPKPVNADADEAPAPKPKAIQFKSGKALAKDAQEAADLARAQLEAATL